MKPARIILLLVALLAGGLAAFLVTRGGDPAPVQQVTNTEVVQEAKMQILVAKTAIGVGERLSATQLEWQDWPAGAVRPEYVTIEALPEAPTELTGAVARFEIFPGEPIREAKLVRADQGYLSAVLSEGMRGVSVEVTAASSAGGFVVPNDHVDVILTTLANGNQRSEVVLANVRVLAIGKRLGEMGASSGVEDPNAQTAPTPVTFDETTIATLELTPGQAETLINSATRGELSLTLRSIVDFNDNSVPDSTSSQTVKLIRFGKEQAIMAANSGNQGAVAEPAVETAPGFAAEPQVLAQ